MNSIKAINRGDSLLSRLS